MFTLIIFVLVLSLLVFVHELGHFLTARRFGIKAEEFGFGFPPRAIGFYKTLAGKWQLLRGSKEVTDAADTIYSINWIPLGGFVKIKGEDGENLEPDSFGSKKIWQRAVVLSAGVTMNLVLAAFLLSIGFMIGLPQSLENLPAGAKVSDRKIQIMGVLDNMPANQAGLKLGDIIVDINGQRFDQQQSLTAYVNKHKGEVLAYNIKRAGENKIYNIKPVVQSGSDQAVIGVYLESTGLIRFTWYQAIWQGIKQTGILVWVILIAFYDLIKGLFMGQGVGGDVAGPVGIATLTGQVARMGISYLIQFTALLSINLAIINFLPIPALDGGRVLFLILEKIKGKPVRKELEGAMHNVGFMLLMLLVVIVTFHDIIKLSAVQQLWHSVSGWF
ncbi:MAG: RIP metalloprotease RseP [Candidatus Falkowbacteria bacterium]